MSPTVAGGAAAGVVARGGSGVDDDAAVSSTVVGVRSGGVRGGLVDAAAVGQIKGPGLQFRVASSLASFSSVSSLDNVESVHQHRYSQPQPTVALASREISFTAAAESAEEVVKYHHNHHQHLPPSPSPSPVLYRDFAIDAADHHKPPQMHPPPFNDPSIIAMGKPLYPIINQHTADNNHMQLHHQNVGDSIITSPPTSAMMMMLSPPANQDIMAMQPHPHIQFQSVPAPAVPPGLVVDHRTISEPDEQSVLSAETAEFIVHPHHHLQDHQQLQQDPYWNSVGPNNAMPGSAFYPSAPQPVFDAFGNPMYYVYPQQPYMGGGEGDAVAVPVEGAYFNPYGWPIYPEGMDPAATQPMYAPPIIQHAVAPASNFGPLSPHSELDANDIQQQQLKRSKSRGAITLKDPATGQIKMLVENGTTKHFI